MARELGISGGDFIRISSARGAHICRAMVTKRLPALQVNGKHVYQIGIPFSWGFRGIAEDAGRTSRTLVNLITPTSFVATRVLLLAPLVLGADITIGTLQVGNLQAAVFVFAMLAMVFFTQRRYAAGGALLAFATVSKMFPGMLIVYLAVRREWRALAWTVGLCAALVGISFLDTGRAPYNAFLHQLPRLLSGEGVRASTPPRKYRS